MNLLAIDTATEGKTRALQRGTRQFHRRDRCQRAWLQDFDGMLVPMNEGLAP